MPDSLCLTFIFFCHPSTKVPIIIGEKTSSKIENVNTNISAIIMLHLILNCYSVNFQSGSAAGQYIAPCAIDNPVSPCGHTSLSSIKPGSLMPLSLKD